jgi:hypothetical protein
MNLSGEELEKLAPMATPETRPTERAPNAELLRSLGRLVRGLSALFWGLPAALVICVQVAQADLFAHLNAIPPAVANIIPTTLATGWLLYALSQLGHFQRQERIWINALDRARVLALINLGLNPFLYWWNRQPDQTFFIVAVEVLAVSGLVFLGNLNLVLYRLSMMLPDESLRQETRHFTMLNRLLVLGILLAGAAYSLLLRHPQSLPVLNMYIESNPTAVSWMFLFLVLLPLAVTMALIWKIKQVILDSVFGG